MANCTISPFPFFQFLDDNGDPYSGALVFVYLAGTSTKTTTYTDKAGSTPNTNPIVLDAAGRAVIFLDPDLGSVKFVIAPSTDTDPPTSPYDTIDAVAPVPFYSISLTISRSLSAFRATTLTTSDNNVSIPLPYMPVILQSYYWASGTIGDTSITISAGTLTNNGDVLVCEWEVNYSAANLNARGTIFGTNVDVGCGANATVCRAKYVISRVDANTVSVSATVLQNTAAGQKNMEGSRTNIGSLDLDTTGYAIEMGMASGTYTIRSTRVTYYRALGSYVL